jgi:hypothetical protein
VRAPGRRRPAGSERGDRGERSPRARATVAFGDVTWRYGHLADAAIEVTVARLTIRVVSKDDLIAMKREAGRPKDLPDIAALTEVERNRPDREPPG